MALKYSSISSSGGTGFNVQLGSKYSYAQFTQAQPSGAYTIKSSNNYTNWDVYLLDANNNLVAYTGTASIAPTSSFSAIVVVNGTVNDILQFSFQSTVFSTAETAYTNAGPFIASVSTTSLPNDGNTVTITGGNYASGLTAVFTGSDLVQRVAQAVTVSSSTSATITRPNTMPVGYAPYTLTVNNPGINAPITSGANTYGGFTVGAIPVWQTSATLTTASTATPYSVTLSATDADGGSSVTYAYVSGSLPAGLSFNASTGVISGTPSTSSGSLINQTYTYTVSATDSGLNTVNRTFSIPYTSVYGGTLSSDATYYYNTFTSNGTFVIPSTLTADVLMIGGGGGGGTNGPGTGWGNGAGAGGAAYGSALSITGGSYAVTVGGGGLGGTGSSTYGTIGNNTTFSIATGYGGGPGGGAGSSSTSAAAGGCGGGVANSTSGGPSTQTNFTGYTGYGTAGGGGNNTGTSAGGGIGQSGPNITAATSQSANGGNGLATWSSWAPISALGQSGYIGGGGGGYNGTHGNGGAGGGGSSGDNTNSTGGFGVANTGGGGGGTQGSGAGNNGGNGGAGIVVIRYTRSQVGG